MYDITATRDGRGDIAQPHSQKADEFLAAEFACIEGDLTPAEFDRVLRRAEQQGFRINDKRA